MRVLMFSWEYPPRVVGGLGNHVAELLPALAALGVSVDLITPRWTDSPATETLDTGEAARITIHRVDPVTVQGDIYQESQQNNMRMAGVAQAVIDQGGTPFDLIHAHDWLVSFAAEQIKEYNKLPLVTTIHATEYGRNRGNLQGPLQHAIHNSEWQLIYESWRIIACTYYMAHQIIDVFACPPDKVDVIPNGVDTRRFDALQGLDLSDFRARFVTPNERLVFSVGRIVYEKGIGVLVAAVPLVLQAMGNVKFVIAGSGGMLPELRRRAAEIGVADRIYFTGFISDEDRDRLLTVADVAVFPSLYEPFGIVALEAMAARTPVVVSNTGGLGEVVQHAETGIWVYPNSPESLAWGILHTLEHPEWAQARADNAYRIVQERFNWQSIATQTLTVYDRVALERKATVWP